MPGRGVGKLGSVRGGNGGGGGGKNDSARALALSVLNEASTRALSMEVLRVGMWALEKSEGVLMTYLLAL